ncbi:MAG: hypothetical protein AABY68_00155 [Pseudomonadota bacterium]
MPTGNVLSVWIVGVWRWAVACMSIMGLMRAQGMATGRFRGIRLMEDKRLICKQPGGHTYMQATVDRIDIPNHLNRQFVVDAPNQVWCDDITYIWTQVR